MVDIKQLMLEEIKKNNQIQSTYLDETEELIDTGLDKSDDNLTAVAIAYLDDKGYRRQGVNLEMAKKKILDISEGYDTIIVQKRRVVETNVFEKATVTELRDAMNISMNNNINSINNKLDRIANRQYEYVVDYVNAIYVEKDRPKNGRLGLEEFESLEEKLNKYASEGWELDKMHNEPKGTRVFLVFKREKMS